MLCGMQNLSSLTTQPVSPAGEAQSLNRCTATYFYILTSWNYIPWAHKSNSGSTAPCVKSDMFQRQLRKKVEDT